jgi:hypothetical protein
MPRLESRSIPHTAVSRRAGRAGAPAGFGSHGAAREWRRRRTAVAVGSWSAAGFFLLGLGCQGPGPGSRSGTLGGDAPDDDLYAIRCITLDSPDRFDLAARVERTLKQVQGLKPELVLVVHGEGSSAVYYGRYRRELRGDRERFSPDHLRDLELVRQLSLPARNPRGGSEFHWPFAQATLEALPRSSTAPADWDLAKADGYWSWQVGVFYNEGAMRQRRLAAEQYCKLLRDQGEEAYYHHGAEVSSVCVGLFPKSAIQVQMLDDAMPSGRRGEPERVRRSTNRIVDPRMLELERRFPEHLENGKRVYQLLRDPVTHEIKERVPAKPFPVLTPRAGR